MPTSRGAGCVLTSAARVCGRQASATLPGGVPKRDITEKEAAANLVADVLNVEKRLAVCVPVDMPPAVYDALVSFAFNVGTGAACRSTLVYHLKHRQWWQACDQLTRWVFVNGERNAGLENRRFRERTYCLKGVK